MEKRKLTTMELMKYRKRKRRDCKPTVSRKPLGARAPLNSLDSEINEGTSRLSAGSTVMNLKDRTSFILPKEHYNKVIRYGERDFARASDVQGLYPRCKFLSLMFKDPPLDWGMKTQLVCTSTNSFEWARMVGGSKQAEAVKAFQRSDDVDLSSLGADPGFGLNYSILHWRFPSASRDINLFKEYESADYKKESKRTVVEKALVREQNEKYKAWQEAFHSLYYSFRSGCCSHFFYKSHWCFALFLSGGQSKNEGRCEPVVIMTKVARNYRDNLRIYGVDFSTPLVQQKQQAGESKLDKCKTSWRPDEKAVVDEGEDLDAIAECEALRDFQNVSIVLPNRESDAEASAASVLHVEGRNAVHCLFDFIMNHVPRLHDVPLILSPSPFLNAACRSAHLTSVAEGSMAGSGDRRHILEIRGCILPFNVLRLCHLFSLSQKDGFEISMRGDDQCEGVNSLVGIEALSSSTNCKMCEVVALRKEFEENPINLMAGLEKIKRLRTGEYIISLARAFSSISL